MRLAEWLADVEARCLPCAGTGSTTPAVLAARDATEVESSRKRVAQAALELRRDLGERRDVPWPLAITTGRALDLHRCEGLAVATAGGVHRPSGWASLAGAAMDAYVLHVLHEGPVADPVADLASIWCAQGRHADVDALYAFLAGAEADAMQGRLAELARAAAALTVDPAWVPRVEVQVGCTVEGALVLRGRVDVMLGGPGTDRPAVLIEVKSGGGHPHHHAQLRHYTLLCALRHGRMPAAAALWHPDDSVTDVYITGSAETSAERIAGAARQLGEIWLGRVPSLHPGPHCGWCPSGDRCPAAERPAPAGAEDAAEQW